MDLLLWVLVAYGITNGVVTSKLADPIRLFFISPPKSEIKSFYDKVRMKVGEMLVCMMCFGFWVGLALSFWHSPTEYRLLDAFLASGACWIIQSVVFNLMLRFGRH